jgi:hypothetical protein
LDSGSADDLLRFFEGKTDRSCHAICDDDKIIDNLVSYDRAAWTLRNGNNRSDNLEMCGLASWSRAEWLTHDGMLRNAAKWVVSRLKARNIVPKRLSIAEVRARNARGYIDHNTYTLATNDGTHWDVGPNFPWDVFGNYVISFFTGGNGDDEDMPLNDADKDFIRGITGAGGGTSIVGVMQGIFNKIHADNSAVLNAINDNTAAILVLAEKLPPSNIPE